MFNTLVPAYDRFNRVSSLGLDFRWRRESARMLAGRKFVLDVGTGTGEMAQALLSNGSRVAAVDIADHMISRARRKLVNHSHVSFDVAPADRLPFEAMTFDGIASAFVIRNLHHAGVLAPSLRECFRVLEVDGMMVHLELTRPPKGMLSVGYNFYMRSVLPLIGRWCFGSTAPQRYLSDTINQFPSSEEMCQRIRWAGFNRVFHYPLHGGIASLFCGIKCSI